MKIGIDVRCLAEGRRTGVEEYTLNLLRNIFSVDKKNEYILFFNSFKSPKINFDWADEYPNVRIKKFRFPNKFLNFSFWYLGWPKIDKMIGGADIIFLPNIIFSGVSKSAKTILTIHDLSFERYPETFSLKKRLWHVFVNPKKICQSADKIIAISNSTKNDLISIYGINPNKVEVIYSGISNKFKIISRNDGKLLKIKEKYNLPYRFIFYFGTIEPRKNIIALIKAFGHFREYADVSLDEELRKYKLIIAGSKGWLEKNIIKEIEASKFKNDIMLIDSVLEEEREYIYNLASIFIFPSFCEGFGFPPLEAMKCGLPTIISNGSSLPEIAGGSAIMIDSGKPEEIAQSILAILSSKKFQEKLIQKGLKKSGEFNWKKSAENFLDIINCLGKNK